MREIEHYVERILDAACLARRDALRVREELLDHLQEIERMGETEKINPEDMIMKLEKEFGNPQELGDAIARAKGKFRTYLKKEMRPRMLLIALAIALPIRLFAVTNFRVHGEGAFPAGISQGDFMLVNKLAKKYHPMDIVLCKEKGVYGIYEVVQVNDRITIKKGDIVKTVLNREIVGRVFLQTR